MKPKASNDAIDIVDIERIIKMLPHRYPFLMIDRVGELIIGKSAKGYKNVTVNEPHFQGHFPEKPIMPGVLIIEAMAQTAAVLVGYSLGNETDGKLVYFMSIENAKFRQPVRPGDTIVIDVKVKQHRKSVWKFEGVAKVGSAIVAESAFTAMIIDNE